MHASLIAVNSCCSTWENWPSDWWTNIRYSAVIGWIRYLILRLCTWWSCEVCILQCSCRTSSDALSPSQTDPVTILVHSLLWLVSYNECCLVIGQLLPGWCLVSVAELSPWLRICLGEHLETQQLLRYSASYWWRRINTALWLVNNNNNYLLSPTGGWVTSAPRKMTGSWNTWLIS